MTVVSHISMRFFGCLVFFVLQSVYVNAQPCGVAQSLNSSQQTQISFLSPLLDTALKYEDLHNIDSLCTVIKSVYAAQGGIPDAVENYASLSTNTSWLSLNNAVLLSRLLIAADSLVYVDLWKTAKGMKPPLYQPHSLFLRTSAEMAAGLLKIADKETDGTRKALYQLWATRALDSLATMQLPTGAFPFPDLRTYNDPVFSSIIQNFLNNCGSDSVNVLQNGWIIDDKGSGEFKFDAGVIANAYYEAFLYTGNVQYKNIALSIGNYMKPLILNSNFNYNTFASLALSRAYQLNNDTSFLDRALINIRYAVSPGQLANGRWVDGHNANSRYHSIMIQNMSPTLALIPPGHVHAAAVDSTVYRAVKNLTDYSFTCGFATGYRWLISAWYVNTPVIPAGLHDTINDLIGRHINQSAINGKFLDVPTMGGYLELLSQTTGVSTVLSQQGFRVFPNPAKELVTVEAEFTEKGAMNLMLYDVSGRLVQQINYGEKEFINVQVHLQQFKPGIYFLELRCGKFAKRSKLIVGE